MLVANGLTGLVTDAVNAASEYHWIVPAAQVPLRFTGEPEHDGFGSENTFVGGATCGTTVINNGVALLSHKAVSPTA